MAEGRKEMSTVIDRMYRTSQSRRNRSAPSIEYAPHYHRIESKGER